MHIKGLAVKHTFLSLVGQRLYKTGSSPDSASSLLQPSRSPQISDFVGFTLHYSGGTVPVFHRSSLLSPTGHLFSYEAIKYRNPH